MWISIHQVLRPPERRHREGDRREPRVSENVLTCKRQVSLRGRVMLTGLIALSSIAVGLFYGAYRRYRSQAAEGLWELKEEALDEAPRLDNTDARFNHTNRVPRVA
jgi:hypothetical protein